MALIHLTKRDTSERMSINTDHIVTIVEVKDGNAKKTHIVVSTGWGHIEPLESYDTVIGAYNVATQTVGR